ncbi:MAG: hypothetical protein ACR2KP_05425 [Egibacteraceae bacterium]
MSYLFVTLGVLFFVPFVDPRRPRRLIHLDLLVLMAVGLGPTLVYFGADQPSGSLAVTVLGLAYLAARLLTAGLRPRARGERLVPLFTVRWLALAVVLVLCLRFTGLAIDNPGVGDIGTASVTGADRITHGQGVYDELPGHTDTYGPAAYLLYVPFEQVYPWEPGTPGTPSYSDPKAGRAAVTVFDLLTLLGLFVLGRRLRPDGAGTLLGLALVYAWATYPYPLLVLRDATNDSLVALLVVWSLVAVGPARSGALAALAAATKFAPLLIAPLLAAGAGERRLRPALVFGATFVLVSLVAFVPLLPAGGPAELYEQTIGFQQGRVGWNSIWAGVPELGRLQTVAQAGVAGLAVVLGFVPRTRSRAQLVALAGGVLVAGQLTLTFWLPHYSVWFAPLALAAIFAAHDCGERVSRRLPGPAASTGAGPHPAVARS